MGENGTAVSRNKILAYGGLATPLAMIGYPIAIWLIPFYSEVTKFELALLADLLLLARFTDVITDPLLGQLGDSTKTRRKPLAFHWWCMHHMPGDDVKLVIFLSDNVYLVLLQ